jgi:capsular polysaccharide transport system permease protein
MSSDPDTPPAAAAAPAPAAAAPAPAAAAPAPAAAAPVKTKVKLITVAPAARPARMLRRHRIAIASFVLCVLLPVLGVGVYLYNFAADQYASRVGFTVRTEETGSAMEVLGGLTSLSSASSSDTDILYKFIQSQELVRAIDETLDLKAIFRKPLNDPYFTLAADARIEDLVAYWKNMVRIYYDPGTGLMEIEVRAFDPLDAQIIATDLFTRSSAMINSLSAVARDDTTRYAREELDEAVARLKDARQALTQFRNATQIVDPMVDIQGQMGLLTSLNAQLATDLIELDILTETAGDSDPRVEQTRRKIDKIEKRIAQEREKLGETDGQNGRTYADLVGTFESLQVDREFAERAYVSALSAYDTAVAEARRQSRYLAAYVNPTLAETPLYPQRAVLLLVASFLLFGVWSIAVLIYYSLHDRR